MKKKERCYYCGRAIMTIPFRVRKPNTTYRDNFAHKVCKDRGCGELLNKV